MTPTTALVIIRCAAIISTSCALVGLYWCGAGMLSFAALFILLAAPSKWESESN